MCTSLLPTSGEFLADVIISLTYLILRHLFLALNSRTAPLLKWTRPICLFGGSHCYSDDAEEERRSGRS